MFTQPQKDHTLFSTFFLTPLVLCGALHAAPTIQIVAPAPASLGGSPVYYEAYSYSSGCANGISAMRIYSAPSVAAYTTNSNHIETFIAFDAGTYNTVVEAWDNCGGVATADVPLTVSSNSGITVFLPSTASASVPIHVAASAQNSACTAGVSAMRIYTSPGVAPYTIDSDRLDAFITLAPGNYNLVVQAWDNCGNVFKSSFVEAAVTLPDKYLYAADYNHIYDFPLSDGSLGSPVLRFTGPIGGLLVDPGSNFVYASGSSVIYVFQIDRQNGSLYPAPGSPYPSNNQYPGNEMAIDPNGHFLYVGGNSNATSVYTYRIDRSSGALSAVASVTRSNAASLTTNSTGQFLFDSLLNISQAGYATDVYAYSVNSNNGTLTPVPGSPYSIPGPTQAPVALTTAWKYLYGAQFYSCNADSECEQTWAYEINTDGSLTPLPGSPFPEPTDITYNGPTYPLADWLARYFWITGYDSSLGEYSINTSSISPTGVLGTFTPTGTNAGGELQFYPIFAEDHSGKYLYSGGLNTGDTVDSVASWAIGSNGEPKPISQSNITTEANTRILALGVSR
jgi:hypothetical protein